MSESEHIAVTVLVVEDECLVREDIVDYLQHSGCAVIEAESGERAIDICNSGRLSTSCSPTSSCAARRTASTWPMPFGRRTPTSRSCMCPEIRAVRTVAWPAACSFKSRIERLKF